MRLLPIWLAIWSVVSLPAYADTLIRRGDVFELRLSGMPVDYAAEFAFAYTVGNDGQVRVPLIGKVNAAGISAAQLAQDIEAKLTAEQIFTHPIAVINLQPLKGFVTVGGTIRTPQAVPWNSEMTLAHAIMRAGDFPFWNSGKVKLTRDRKTTFYNLRRIDKDPTQNPKLLPGDEVTVLE